MQKSDARIIILIMKEWGRDATPSAGIGRVLVGSIYNSTISFLSLSVIILMPMSPSIVGSVQSLHSVDGVRSYFFLLETGKDFPISEVEVQEN